MKDQLHTFLSEEMEEILKAIGELAPINEGERFCKFCNNQVSTKSIQIIYKLNNTYCYVCKDSDCIDKYNGVK